MEKAGLSVLVVVSDEIVVGMSSHVGGGNLHIFIAGNVHAGRIVVFIVFPGGDGEGGDCPFSVVHNSVDVRREDGVGVIVDGNRRVCPPEEGLRCGSPVIELTFDLDIGFAGIESDGGHTFGAVHFVDLAQMNGAGAVGILFQEIIHRRVGGGTMVLGPVKFDAAGDPGTCKTHEGRFDYMVVIDKIVVVRFVQGPLDAAAQFGKDHEFQVFVFQVDGVVGDVFFRVGNFFGYGQGIDFSGTALVGSFFDEEGIFFGRVDFIGGDDGVLFPDFYG